MRHRIVVGVNDSTPSRVAVAWAAARVADLTGEGELVLVHVPPAGADPCRGAGVKSAVAGAQLLARAEETVTLRHPSTSVRKELIHGDLFDALRAASVGTDMIVVGTHKTGFIRGRVFGSRSLRIAAEARCPIAVVPESAHRSRSGIVVGIKESAGGRAALELAAAEARRTGQELTLIRAWDTPLRVGPDSGPIIDGPECRRSAEAVRVLKDAGEVIRSRYPDVVTRSRVVRRSVAEALLNAAASAGLLMIGESERRAESRPLGEVGHDVLLNLVGPTILVPAPEAAECRDVS